MNDKEKIELCYKAGMKNYWASGRADMANGNPIVEEDRLNLKSISIIKRRVELKKLFRRGNWCLGQGFIYRNLFFLNQINGGDEWATYRFGEDGEIFQFESITMMAFIKDGRFEKLLNDILKATEEQLRKCEY